MTQANLGNVLAALGERAPVYGAARGGAAYREALREYRRDRNPLDWART